MDKEAGRIWGRQVKKSGGHSVIRRLSVFSLFPLVNALFSLTNKKMKGEKKTKKKRITALSKCCTRFVDLPSPISFFSYLFASLNALTCFFANMFQNYFTA